MKGIFEQVQEVEVAAAQIGHEVELCEGTQKALLEGLFDLVRPYSGGRLGGQLRYVQYRDWILQFDAYARGYGPHVEREYYDNRGRWQASGESKITLQAAKGLLAELQTRLAALRPRLEQEREAAQAFLQKVSAVLE